MKIVKKICAVSAAAITLFGCTAPQNSNNSSTPTISYESTLTSADSYTPETAPMPVLSIQTKSTDPNVMDFVNEPIAEHVSELMKLWTPPPFDPPAPYYEDCTLTLKDSDGSELMTNAEGQVKVRGNWTTMYPKQPLKIKFTEKQNLLGLNDGAEFKNCWDFVLDGKSGMYMDVNSELVGKNFLYMLSSEKYSTWLRNAFEALSPEKQNALKPTIDECATIAKNYGIAGANAKYGLAWTKLWVKNYNAMTDDGPICNELVSKSAAGEFALIVYSKLRSVAETADASVNNIAVAAYNDGYKGIG
ncbi:MAG: hypothetical protein J6U00_02530, partial [Ruminococcus sp.]|nr:hypothetical protein [Ruminococcus sp.]